MTTTQTKTVVKEPKVRIFELTDQQNSTYKLEGSDDVYLRAPHRRIIPSTSIWVNPKNGEYTRIRYIKGVQEIEVDIQETKKRKPNLATGADAIVFEQGKLVVVEEGDGKTLCEYLTKCSLNESNPDRKQDATIIFREIVKEAEAAKAIEDFFNEKKIYDAIGKLAIEEGGKIRYKEESIDFLCSLFKVVGFEADAYREKLQALIAFGRVNPKQFLTSIADEQAQVKSLILSAIEAGIAAFQGDKFSFEGGKVITTVKAKKTDDKIQEVANFLMTGEASLDMQQLTLAVRHNNEKIALSSSDGELAFEQTD